MKKCRLALRPSGTANLFKKTLMNEMLPDALQYYGPQIVLECTARLLRKKMARDELRFIVH